MSFLDLLKQEAKQAEASKKEGKPVDPAQVAIAITGVEAAMPKPPSSVPEPLDEESIPEVVDGIFRQAVAQRASDIHFKPSEKALTAYFRIDGSMVEHKAFNILFHHPIVARIKILAGLRIDEHRLPQDGKTSFQAGEGKDVDLRVSVLPTQYGEKVVIRLLEKNQRRVELRDLGMLPNILLKVERHLQATYGMVLAVGPTGSGKSTSLFSMISQFDASKLNISTLEDPIEYKIPNATQTQVSADIGFDFSDGLRTLVRQDPDIIMVGEIRDQKTAALAIESALTGHLVFSTLHTNTAVGTIQRLLNMGIDRFLITAAVKLIISQRLVRKICSACREAYAVPEKYHSLLRQEIQVDPAQAYLYKSQGCEACKGTGYSGRIGLFEVLEVTPAIEELVIADASPSQIEAKAVEQGMVLLRKDALSKAITGDITIQEAIRAMA